MKNPGEELAPSSLVSPIKFSQPLQVYIALRGREEKEEKEEEKEEKEEKEEGDDKLRHPQKRERKRYSLVKRNKSVVHTD